MGLSDSKPICAAALINPTHCYTLSLIFFICAFLKLFSHASIFLQLFQIVPYVTLCDLYLGAIFDLRAACG